MVVVSASEASSNIAQLKGCLYWTDFAGCTVTYLYCLALYTYSSKHWKSVRMATAQIAVSLLKLFPPLAAMWTDGQVDGRGTETEG